MGNNCQFLQAGPLGFAQYPYTPERNLPYGTEEYLIELLDDGGTKFSVYDPDAKSIEIEFTDGEHRFALEKDSKDVWKLILYDIPAGLRYMKWYVNDVELINKKAPIIYGYGGAYNFVEIPERDEDFYYLKDVPHGSLRLEYYNSGFTGEPRACVVYTPPSYDTHQERFYPVLYAQAGGGENETAWSQQGKINFILDNLIAEGKCREMLVVMNAGYVFPKERKNCDDADAMLDNFSQLLIKDCIPFIEKKFRVIPEASSRAICGNSMGASQTQWLAFHYPGVASYMGVFSGRLLEEIREQPGHYDPSKYYADGNQETFNKEFQYVLYARGQKEGGAQQEQEVEKLKESGFHINFFMQKGKHEWQFWRKAVREFLTHLFIQN
ncbi:MAG: hypothetical protein LUI14_02490 [Lachnospiraceae bacterium]|nr:hypothetical protein [Lachnospiraceae bacterium]